MNYDVILCTKDRPDEVLTFSRSLLEQSILPNNFIVVDASFNENTLHKDLANMFSDTPVIIIYLTAPPGLTRQRNLGCRYIHQNSQIVFFFDDDVILSDPFYIEKILDKYSNDTNRQIGSIFGRIITPSSPCEASEKKSMLQSIRSFALRKTLGLLSRMFMISSSKVYHVLPSGMNTSNQHKTNQECFVKWQPGCCMSFRKEVLNKDLFDETLTGYSMREDLDMSYRVAKRYRILYLPSASLLHAVSPAERLDVVKFGEADLMSWYWFVIKNMTLINKIIFYWSAWGYIFILFLSAMTYRKRDDYLRAVGGLKEFLKLLRIKRSKSG